MKIQNINSGFLKTTAVSGSSGLRKSPVSFIKRKLAIAVVPNDRRVRGERVRIKTKRWRKIYVVKKEATWVEKKE